jgi:hypothetical protein
LTLYRNKHVIKNGNKLIDKTFKKKKKEEIFKRNRKMIADK